MKSDTGAGADRLRHHLAINPHRDVPITEVAEATGYSSSGGGFRNAISRLRSLNLAGGRGELRINPDLLGAQPNSNSH